MTLPPLAAQQLRHHLWRVPILDHFGWKPSDDRIGRYIVNDQCAGGDDRARPHRDTFHNHGAMPDPYIVANRYINNFWLEGQSGIGELKGV